MSRLAGRVALVTGGGRGIGRAIALALAGAGAAVIVTGRDTARLATVQAEIAGHGGTALALGCDVSDSAAVSRAFADASAQLGPIDILVNNAGITASVKLAEMDDATWEQIMRVNVTGPFYCCRAAVPGMLARKWGRIINVASYAGLHGIAFSAAYSASKHALVGLTRSLALELGRAGINTNALCPGWVESDMLDAAVANIMAKTGRSAEDTRAAMLALASQPRMITPEEVAAAALRLAGADGDAINGQTILFDQ